MRQAPAHPQRSHPRHAAGLLTYKVGYRFKDTEDDDGPDGGS